MKKQRRISHKAREVWTSKHGTIPANLLIHHVDGNPGNDDIANLMCVTTKEHVELHKVLDTYRNGSQTITRVYGTRPEDFVIL